MIQRVSEVRSQIRLKRSLYGENNKTFGYWRVKLDRR